MKTLSLFAVSVFAAALSDSTVMAAPFTSGDLVIYRVGDGSHALTKSGSPVFLDEYTVTGALVQSIPTGIYAQDIGYAPGEGALTRSGDGRSLAFTGFSSLTTGSGGELVSTSNSANPRLVALANSAGNINRSTVLTDWPGTVGNQPYGAYTPNGTDIYLVGSAGGLRYTTVGSTTSTQLVTSSYRTVNGAGGQLYGDLGSGSTRIREIGTGFPTSGPQTVVGLPGITSTNSPSAFAFQFADLSPTVPGVDTLYIADNALNSSYSNFGGGIEKFCLDNGTWTYKGSVAAAGVRGLAISVLDSANAASAVVNLFGTVGGAGTSNGAGGYSGSGSLYSFADATGFDGVLSGSASVIATASNNELFEGVAFAPVPEPSTAVLAVMAGAGALLWLRRRMQTTGKTASFDIRHSLTWRQRVGSPSST